jgi:signal transduction histidine kinase
MALPKEPIMNSKTEEKIKNLKIPIDRKAGVLALTVIEGRPFNITDAVNDPIVNQKCRGRIGTKAFATVPLWGREKVIGVIAVDNAFNNRAITDEDLAMLEAFAGHAGYMIEQSQLQAKLGEQLIQLNEMKNLLLEMERLAAWSKMAGILAHEIRSSLVPIGGFARRLYRNFPEDDRRKEEADIIVQEVKRLEMILNQLLSSGQLPPPNLQVSNINRIIKDTLLFMDNEFRQKHIQTVINLSPDLPDLIVDNWQMQLMFFNLFQNSIRTIANSGELRIDTTNDDQFVYINVTNSGVGFSKEVMKQIFDPFFTVNKQRFGMGLSVVKQVVDLHKGTIDIKSRPNVGTTFSIKLPIFTGKNS